MLNLNLYCRQHSDILEKYLSALDNILPAELYLDYENDDGGNFDSDIAGQLENYGLCASSAQGATKLVIMPEELDIVIKIGAVGGLFYNYDYEDADDDEPCSFDENYELWRGCAADNYCEAECDAYDEIKTHYAAALPFFLPEKVIVHGDHTYYIQQSISFTYSDAECYHDDILNKTSHKSRTIVRHKLTNSRFEDVRLPNSWLAIGYEKYGAEALNALMSYLIKTESGIRANRDFHYSNFGFIDDDVPVIFDYAGFEEDF